jgi:hypothetical protein
VKLLQTQTDTQLKQTTKTSHFDTNPTYFANNIHTISDIENNDITPLLDISELENRADLETFLNHDKRGLSSYFQNIYSALKTDNLYKFLKSANKMIDLITKDKLFQDIYNTPMKPKSLRLAKVLTEERETEKREIKSSLFSDDFQYTNMEKNIILANEKREMEYKKKLDNFNNHFKKLDISEHLQKVINDSIGFNSIVSKFRPHHHNKSDKSIYRADLTLLEDIKEFKKILDKKGNQKKLSNVEFITFHNKVELNTIDDYFNLHLHNLIKFSNTSSAESPLILDSLRRGLYLLNTVIQLIYPFFNLSKSQNGYYLTEKNRKLLDDPLHLLTSMALLYNVKKEELAYSKLSKKFQNLDKFSKGAYVNLKEKTKPAFITSYKFDNDRIILDELRETDFLNIETKATETAEKVLNYQGEFYNHEYEKRFHDFVDEVAKKNLLKILNSKKKETQNKLKMWAEGRKKKLANGQIISFMIKKNTHGIPFLSFSISAGVKGRRTAKQIIDNENHFKRKLIKMDLLHNAKLSALKTFKKSIIDNLKLEIREIVLEELTKSKYNNIDTKLRSYLYSALSIELNTIERHLKHTKNNLFILDRKINNLGFRRNNINFTKRTGVKRSKYWKIDSFLNQKLEHKLGEESISRLFDFLERNEIDLKTNHRFNIDLVSLFRTIAKLDHHTRKELASESEIFETFLQFQISQTKIRKESLEKLKYKVN